MQDQRNLIFDPCVIHFLDVFFEKTISFRPKSRESRERAPGPKQSSAAEITPTKAVVSLLSKKSMVGAEGQKRIPHTLASATRPVANRVR